LAPIQIAALQRRACPSGNATARFAQVAGRLAHREVALDDLAQFVDSDQEKVRLGAIVDLRCENHLGDDVVDRASFPDRTVVEPEPLIEVESSTSDKVFNQLTVNSAVGEVRHIIESRYAGQLVPFGNLIGS
jgi:hypothetical protein